MCKNDPTFFDLDLLKSVTGALVGTTTALAIYFLTIRHDRKKSQKQKEAEGRNKIMYLKVLISSFKDKLSDTTISINEVIEKFEADPISYHLPVIAVNESASLLNSLLRSEELFIAHNDLFGIGRIKNYNNLRNEISFYLTQTEQLFDMNIRAKNYDFERKKNISRKIDKIMGDIIGLFDLKQVALKDKEELDRIFKEFHDNLINRQDVKYYHDKFLMPVLDVLLNYTKEKQVSAILFESKEASIDFQHIEANNLAHLSSLKDIYQKFNDLTKNFEEDTKHIMQKE